MRIVWHGTTCKFASLFVDQDVYFHGYYFSTKPIAKLFKLRCIVKTSSFSQFIDIFVVFCDTLLHLTLNLRHLTQFCIKFVVVIFIELVVHGIRTRGRRLVGAGGQPIYFLIRVSTLIWNKANDWMKPAVWWVLPNQCDNLSSKKSS